MTKSRKKKKGGSFLIYTKKKDKKIIIKGTSPFFVCLSRGGRKVPLSSYTFIYTYIVLGSSNYYRDEPNPEYEP